VIQADDHAESERLVAVVFNGTNLVSSSGLQNVLAHMKIYSINVWQPAGRKSAK
jgi:hypothetical protein